MPKYQLAECPKCGTGLPAAWGRFMATVSRAPAGALGTDQLRQSYTPVPTDREQR